MEKKSYLFAYGTLLDDDVRKRVLGHTPNVISAALRGFRKTEILLDEISYPILIEDAKASIAVEGGYFEVSNTDLYKLDIYESDAYRRKRVKLENGVEAWVYYK